MRSHDFGGVSACLYDRPLHAEHRRVRRAIATGTSRSSRRYPQHSAIADKSPVQPRRAARSALDLADRHSRTGGVGQIA